MHKGIVYLHIQSKPACVSQRWYSSGGEKGKRKRKKRSTSQVNGKKVQAKNNAGKENVIICMTVMQVHVDESKEVLAKR